MNAGDFSGKRCLRDPRVLGLGPMVTQRGMQGPQEEFSALQVPLRSSYFIDSPNKMKENKRKNVFQYQGSNVKLLPPQASALAPSLTALNKNVQMIRNLVTRDAEHPDIWGPF